MVPWKLKVPLQSTFIQIIIIGVGVASAQQCGSQASGALCSGGLCCSEFGWCGSTAAYCTIPGCQSQCWGSPSPPPPAAPPPPFTPPPPPSPSGGSISDIITPQMFDEMLKYRNDPRCFAVGFYVYDAFVTAASFFPGFGTTGDTATRQREIAAFLGQTSHETTGGWATADDGPYAWGYCYVREVSPDGNYCSPSVEWPCAAGQSYYGRGPIQISHNYNYGPAGQEISEDLLNNPDLVATDAVISFKTAIWFWMTEQLPKPSCHDVIIGNWTPSSSDVTAGRLPGYGVTINIINGGLECGIGQDPRVDDRIGFFKRYCDLFGIEYGDNLDCATQRPFGYGLVVDTK